jgi:hypothetical protein
MTTKFWNEVDNFVEIDNLVNENEVEDFHECTEFENFES